MAGHFVVWRISPDDRDGALNAFPGSQWTGVAHAAGVANGAGGHFTGWDNNTRAALNQVRDGRGGLANRNNLPPHRYLSFPPGAPTAAQVAYLRGASWTIDLVRPSDAGFGVVGLCVAALNHWANGNKVDALAAQMTHGATSIEIYYIGGKEMF